MRDWLRRFGMALDRLLNVVGSNGSPDETISIHAAHERKDKLWACVMCKWLGLTVEKNHCDKVLTGEPTAPAAGLRALLQLVAVATVIAGVWFKAWEWFCDLDIRGP